MAERLPKRAVHQFAPVDTPSAVARFLDHWRPDAGLFVDSEIWPNMLMGARTKGVRLAIVNGRLSAKSFAGWRYVKRMAKTLFSLYDLCLVQDEQTAERFRTLGASNVKVTGNLKADATPLPVDAQKLAALAECLAGRPIFLAASTHPGEDETILPAHDRLRARFPSLATIIVPRHAERGGDIAKLCGGRAIIRRSQGQMPDASTAIYIADTMGELGLFYRTASFALIGGSLIAHGGQNPLEAARLGAAVMAGPHTDNFREAYDRIFAAQGLGRVATCADIVALAGRLLSDPPAASAFGKAAAAAATSLGGALTRTRLAVEALLDQHANA
jgi:3-deoxy-D-manno-octulosonic-acid transferase